jgi:hypothetical protein
MRPTTTISMPISMKYATIISILTSVLSMLLVLLNTSFYLVVKFSLSCHPMYHIIFSQVGAKPQATLSFDLGVVEAFETKMDLEASNFDEVEDVDTDSSGCMLPGNDDYILKFTIPEELHNKQIDAVASRRLHFGWLYVEIEAWT